MIDVDESKLNLEERLGLAYCRLNCWEWDNILGPKPTNYDDLPCVRPGTVIGRIKNKAWRKYRRSKMQYTHPAFDAIRSILGEIKTSFYWWKFVLGKTEEEWFVWWVTERFNNQN